MIAVEISDIKQAIKDRFKEKIINGTPIKADPLLSKIDYNTMELEFLAQIDQSQISLDLIDKLQTFNIEAGNYIEFKGGVINRSDPTLFTFIFVATTCNGGL